VGGFRYRGQKFHETKLHPLAFKRQLLAASSNPIITPIGQLISAKQATASRVSFEDHLTEHLQRVCWVTRLKRVAQFKFTKGTVRKQAELRRIAQAHAGMKLSPGLLVPM